MTVFDLSNFEREGNIENDVHFSSLDGLKSNLDQMIQNCLKTVQIYTPDMEPEIYNGADFISSLLSFARGNRHARIQILVIDTMSAVQRGHGLISLAQELTSTVEIRVPEEEYRQDKLGFILVDSKAFLYRPDIKSSQGVYNSNCKYRSGKLAEIFTSAWEHAQPDPQTRRLNI